MFIVCVIVEYLAQKYNVSRERQDAFAAKSQQRAEAAIKAGHFEKEIVAVLSNKTCQPVLVDEHPRFSTTLEKLSLLKPCFVESDNLDVSQMSVCVFHLLQGRFL